ncbi:mug158 [Symbiodinium sp. CCMP2592]|nr:mug158 [Symbiodinium sp. CCMP2592]
MARLTILAHGVPADLRDTQLRVDQPGENITRECKDAWLAKAKQFLKKERKREAEVQQDEPATKRRKKNEAATPQPTRLSAYDLLLAKDNMLRSVHGEGLVAFAGKESEDSGLPLTSRPTLVEVSDQGSIPCSEDAFETFHLGIRKFMLEDPYHCMWKSLLNGIKKAGMYPAVSLTTVWLNLHDGPWASQKWYSSIAEMWKEYTGTFEAGDPLFQQILARLKRFNVNMSARQLLIDMRRGDVSFLHRRGNKVQPSRWFSWQTAFLARLESPGDMHLQFALLVFFGIQMGFLQKSADAGATLESLTESAAPAEESGTMRRERLRRSNLQSRCKNTLHAVTAILADEPLLRTAGFILAMSESARSWYSEIRSSLRSRAQCESYNIALASGSNLLPAISAIMGTLRDPEKLAAGGLAVQDFRGNSQIIRLRPDDAEVLEQDELAHGMQRLVLLTAFSWLSAEAVRLFAFPSAFLALLDLQERERTLLHCKKVWTAWLAHRDRPLPAWRRTVARSCLNEVLVREVFQHLASSDFATVSTELETYLRGIARSIATTAVCEDAFQRLELAERQVAQRRLSSQEVWATVLNKQVLSDVYSFSEIDLPACPAAAGEQLPSTIYHCKRLDASMEECLGSFNITTIALNFEL